MTHCDHYCLKQGYRTNLSPAYYLDTPRGITYQPDVYELAAFLAQRSRVKFILDIGSGNGRKLSGLVGQYDLVAIDCGANREIIARNLPQALFIEADLETGLPDLSAIDLSQTLVIAADVLEHLMDPDAFLQGIAKLGKICPWLLISTPDRLLCRGYEDMGPPANPCHVREWTLDEFAGLLRQYQLSPHMLGYTVNTDHHLQKTGILALVGTEVYRPGSPSITALAVINLYNEEDILPEVVGHLLSQGIDVQLVDNWSTDRSGDIGRSLARSYPERVFFRQFPEQPSRYYEWEKMLVHTTNIASASPYNWILHYDADELRESPWPGVSLAEALAFVDAQGYNAVDFTVLDFRPVRIDPQPAGSIRERLPFFEFGRRPGHFLQIKAWKNQPGVPVDIASSGGHQAEFDDRRIFPLKFLNCHYPLRSQEQARKKVFPDRLARFSPAEKQERGWHSQYDHYDQQSDFVWDRRVLDGSFHPQQFALEYLVERISGIGINRK